jgi:penicillin V acylase-like amidase (Ntn superfamily)
MKNGARILVGILIGCLAFPPSVLPCSSIVLTNKRYPVFATNYDNQFWPGQIFINARNVRKTSWEAGTTGRAASWTSRYGSVTITCVAYQLPWAGMNEAGLCFSTMSLGETRPAPPDALPPLSGPFWWQYMLDTCATIEEVLAAAEDVRMTDTEDHYLVCDRSGDCAVFEFLGGRMVVHRGDSLPIRALTNRSYSSCLGHWTKKGSPPSDAYHSFNRFSRLAERLGRFKETSAEGAMTYAFGMLENVASPQTRWSLVFDTGNRVFHIRSFKNTRLRSIDLTKIDFSCGRPARMLDAHADLAGDITGSFAEYSHEAALGQALKALAYFRPGFSEDLVREVLGLFESFACEKIPAKK